MSNIHKLTRRGLLGALALLVASGSPIAQSADPVRGGDLVVALQSPPPILTSAFNSAGFVGVVSAKMLEGLLSYDFELNPRPALARSWSLSEDGMSLTFELRQNVTWHDGTPFSSKDVKFSLMNVWKEMHPRGRSTFANVASVDTPDDHTVVIHLSEPAPAMLSAFSSYESQVLPAHLYEGTDINTNPHNNAPVGTGPFMFDEWEKGNFIRLVRNPNYWDEGKPYLDSIVFRYIPDAGGRAAALETGEVHLSTFSPVPFSDVTRLESLEHLAIETRGYEYLSPIFLLDLNKRGEYLGNKKVRQALSHALNRQFIVDTVWYGFGKIATGPVPSTHVRYYTDDVPVYEYDPKKAEALLDEAGYPRKDGNMRFKISMDYSVFGETYPRLAEYIKQAFRQVGVDLELRSQDIGSMIRRVFTDYDYDIMMNYWYAMPDPTMGVTRLYWSENIRQGVPFANANGYSNDRVDEIIVEVQKENDETRRKELFAEFQRIAQDDVPVLDLFEMQFFTIYNKSVKDHTIGGDSVYGSFSTTYIER